MNDPLPKLSTPWALTRADTQGADEAAQVETWEGRSVPTPWPAAYGGDLSVGALSAVLRSAAEGQRVHSLQLAFLLPGDRDRGVSYAVERVRDGFRYANRSVRIAQDGRVIAAGTASLRSPRAGEQHTAPAPPLADTPQPDSLPTAAEAITARGPQASGTSDAEALDAYWAAGRGLDTRHIEPPLYGETVEPRTVNRLWVRFTPHCQDQRELLDTAAGRAALIAYLADDTILEPAVASLGIGWLAPGLFTTTVQQNVWFHSDFDAAGWLLFSQRLVSRVGDHAVCSGEIFTSAGVLVATVLQEGIVRVRLPRS